TGIPTVDEFESLRAIAARDIDTFKRYYVMVEDPAQPYGHMSARGNRHVAELIAAALRDTASGGPAPRPRQAERSAPPTRGGSADAKRPARATPAFDAATVHR